MSPRVESEIRPLQLGDVPLIRALSRRCFEKLWEPKDFSFFLSHGHGCNYGTFLGEGYQTLGSYCLALLVDGELDVISVATNPDMRTKGLAKTLLSTVLTLKSVKKAFLEVDETNLAAVGLYTSLGFEVTDKRKAYYDGKRDALVMQWLRPRP